MKRVSVAFALAVLACSARSEPRGREPVSSSPPPSPTPTDAAAAVPTAMDAPSPTPDRPMTPRTVYPVVKREPDGNGTRVTIGIGKRQGVNKTWKAHLVDKEGRDVRGGELTLTVVGETTTSATTKLRYDGFPTDVQAHVDSH